MIAIGGAKLKGKASPEEGSDEEEAGESGGEEDKEDAAKAVADALGVKSADIPAL